MILYRKEGPAYVSPAKNRVHFDRGGGGAEPHRLRRRAVHPDAPGVPGQVQEAPEEAPQETGEAPSVTEGSETDRGFLLDNVLHAQEGDIHYHIYVPDSYDGSESYALYLTLPGYEGLYFQGVGQNLYSEDFAFEALNYNDKMIVAAPQLNDWGETSAEQAIALTEYLLGHYNFDR